MIEGKELELKADFGDQRQDVVVDSLAMAQDKSVQVSATSVSSRPTSATPSRTHAHTLSCPHAFARDYSPVDHLSQLMGLQPRAEANVERAQPASARRLQQPLQHLPCDRSFAWHKADVTPQVHALEDDLAPALADHA